MMSSRLQAKANINVIQPQTFHMSDCFSLVLLVFHFAPHLLMFSQKRPIYSKCSHVCQASQLFANPGILLLKSGFHVAILHAILQIQVVPSEPKSP